jgi:hypothetical protein
MAVSKQHILDEIRRTAAANGGIALGRDAFLRETGIRQADWYPMYWVRWGDALTEAGFAPNAFQDRLPDEELLEKLAALVRDLGRVPVDGEIRQRPKSDPEFPSHSTFLRFGSKVDLVARLIEYCQAMGGLDDVIAICEARATKARRPARAVAEAPPADSEFGFVYLLRSGAHYKIGRTNSTGRRQRELAIQLPEKATMVHEIRTDDPPGIEAYWHNRFKDRRKNGEWFELSAADIAAFKRRKFM